MQKPARGITVKSCVTEEDGFSLYRVRKKLLARAPGFSTRWHCHKSFFVRLYSNRQRASESRPFGLIT
jgi:hypothetical protein